MLQRWKFLHCGCVQPSPTPLPGARTALYQAPGLPESAGIGGIPVACAAGRSFW